MAGKEIKKIIQEPKMAKDEITVIQIIWKEDGKRYAKYSDGTEAEKAPKKGYGAENLKRQAEAKKK